jgi:hypothetical protein
MLRGRVGRLNTGKGSKQITKKVQNQGEKYDGFDFAHDDGERVGTVADVGMCSLQPRHGDSQGACSHKRSNEGTVHFSTQLSTYTMLQA